jgi:hypothetical protein
MDSRGPHTSARQRMLRADAEGSQSACGGRVYAPLDVRCRGLMSCNSSVISSEVADLMGSEESR